MQLVIFNGMIEATYADEMSQRLFALYPTASIYTIADSTPGIDIGQELPAGAVLTPQYVSKLQIRRAMRALGIESQLDALLESSSEFKADWADAQVIDLSDVVTATALSQASIDLVSVKAKITELEQ